jgi:hypothetical protein
MDELLSVSVDVIILGYNVARATFYISYENAR